MKKKKKLKKNRKRNHLTDVHQRQLRKKRQKLPLNMRYTTIKILQARWTIVLGCFCLWLMFFAGYILEQNHVLWFPEAGAGILIGVFLKKENLPKVSGQVYSSTSLMELIRWKLNNPVQMQSMVRFDTEFFFIFLLPPIIFESGWCFYLLLRL